MDLNELVKRTNIEYENNLHDWEFYRAAINAQLDGGNPRAVHWGQSLDSSHKDKTWLIQRPWEGRKAYYRRLQKCADTGMSKTIIDTIIGHMLDGFSGLKFTAGSQEQKDKIQNNIDGSGLSFRFFLRDYLEELLGMGKGIIATDNPSEVNTDTLPNSYIIKRENFVDWAQEAGQYKYATWRTYRQAIVAFNYSTIEQRVFWSETEYMLLEKIGKKEWMKKIPETPNNKMIVPVTSTMAGRTGISIIESAAKYDAKIMNIDSTIEEILDLQGISIPYIPKAAKDTLPTNPDQTVQFSTSSLLGLAPGDPIPGFMTFPASSLDSHFRQIERLNNVAFDTSHLRSNTSYTQAISGESKAWDWKNQTEPLLYAIRDVTNQQFSEVFRQQEIMSDKSLQVELEWKEFNVRSLQEELAQIMNVLTIGVGATGNANLRKKAYRLKNPNTPASELRIIDQEIEEEEKTKSERAKMTIPANIDNLEID